MGSHCLTSYMMNVNVQGYPERCKCHWCYMVFAVLQASPAELTHAPATERQTK